MTFTLDQLVGFAIVIGAALGAMIVGYKRGEKERKEQIVRTAEMPIQQWFFDGPLNEHFRLMKEQVRLLREILDAVAPRHPPRRHED